MMHECESEMICKLTHSETKIPYFNAGIYLENKKKIGKVDEIFGPIQNVMFSVKPDPGIVAKSFEKDDVFYVATDKLLPMSRFTNPGGGGGGGRGGGRAGGRGGGRGGRGGGRGGRSPMGRGGGRGGKSNNAIIYDSQSHIKSVCHMLNHFLFLVPPFETILRYAVRFWPWRRAWRRTRWLWPWRSRWKGKILSK